MAKLGQAADAQSPALADLNASAGQLATLFENLPDFADASRTSFKSLGELGARAARRSTPRSRRSPSCDRVAAKTPELANNLDFVLEHLDDRKRAVEKDPRSPGGQGYTGFEALLQYVFDQTMAINAFDSNGYMLKVNLFLSQCSDYQNLQSLKKKLKEDPSFYEECAAILGPHQPGHHAAGPELHRGAGDARRARAPVAKKRRSRAAPKAPDVADAQEDSEEGRRGADPEPRGHARHRSSRPAADEPAGPAAALPVAPNGLPQAPSAADAQGLLDFLLAP